ncbi:MAG: hypothetical protein ABI325_00880 [Ginsengibacter sp.]
MRLAKSPLLKSIIKIIRTQFPEQNEGEVKPDSENKPSYTRRRFIADGTKGALVTVLATSLPLLNSCSSGNQDKHNDYSEKKRFVSL